MQSRLMTVLFAGLVATGAVASATGQTTTPPTSGLFTGIGLPELVLVATDDGLTTSQAEIPAGRYLVTLDNRSWDDLVIEFLRFGPDPLVGDASCETGIPPECFTWYSAVYHPGGVSARSPQVVLDLPGGDYGLWGAGILAEAPAARLKIIGDPDAPVTGPEPVATTVTIAEQKGSGGLGLDIEDSMTAGLQLIQIHNASEQLIRLDAAQYPDEFTTEQVATMEALTLSGDQEPSPDGLDPRRFRSVFSPSPLSPGADQWVPIRLEPGFAYFATFSSVPIDSELSAGWIKAANMVVPVSG